MTETDNNKKQWVVLQSEIYPGEGRASGMWIGCTEFDSAEDAKRFIEDVIRSEWTTTITIPTDDDSFHEEMLADHKGYQSDPESIKWSSVYYSEDGEMAWTEIDDQTKLIEMVEKKPKGERMSTTC